MPAYRFEAANSMGHVSRGVLEADSARAARAQLRAQGLVPLALEVLAHGQGEDAGRSRGRLRETDLAMATRQIAALLSARLPLATALAATIEQAERQTLRELLSAVRSEVVAGARLADALGRFPQQFPQVYRATVAAGEEAGDLALVMERLAGYLEQRQALRGRVLSAVLYPAVVTSVALAIVLFLMTFVLPQVVQVFEQTHQSLPLPTRMLLAISAMLRTFGPLLLLLAPALYFALAAWLRQPGPRAGWHALLLRLPVFGAVLRALDSARFAGTLAILSASGVPVLRALEAARGTLRNAVLAQAVSTGISQVREGETLARALGRARVFPPMLIHLVASGEATGELAAMLERAARIQGQEVERRLLVLSTLLEPLLILAMGAIVLGIVLAVLLPIIEINQLVR